MKVGDYVRTKKRMFQPPQIAKIRSMVKDSGYHNQYYIELDHNLIPDYEFHIYEEDIDKSNSDIMELIRVGDYVNGFRITSVYDDDSVANENNLKHKKCLGKNIYDEDYQEYLIYEEDIKSIVTKEQFESMEYKI